MLNRRVQREFVGVIEVLRFDGLGDVPIRFAQQIGNALVHGGQCCRFRQFAEGLNSLHTLIEVQRRSRLQGTHRQVNRNVYAFVFITRAQTVEDELQNLLRQTGRFDLHTELRHSELHGLDQIQIQLLLDQDAQDPERGPTQGVRVFAAGRQHADAEDAHEGVELVGNGHSGAGQRAWQFSASAAGHVLLVQRQCNVFGFAVGQGVVVACNALHLGKLANHFGRQVALGQQACTCGALSIAANAWRNERSELGDALSLVKHRTQLRLEHHVLQALVERLQLLLLVLLKEELGVGQTGANDFLVTVDDLGRVLAVDVRDRNEARQ